MSRSRRHLLVLRFINSLPLASFFFGTTRLLVVPVAYMISMSAVYRPVALCSDCCMGADRVFFTARRCGIGRERGINAMAVCLSVRLQLVSLCPPKNLRFCQYGYTSHHAEQLQFSYRHPKGPAWWRCDHFCMTDANIVAIRCEFHIFWCIPFFLDPGGSVCQI